jgi:endonuclease-3
MTLVKKPRSAQERKRRVSTLLRRLNKDYPNVECALHHRSAWELLAATILSAQCTDVRVNKVTTGLFAKLPTVYDMAAVQSEVLEREIQSTGFFRNKTKSLIGAARRIIADHGGEVPATMDELLALPGVARKTANVVLGSWFGKATGVVVDTHVQRIANRLDLTKQQDPVKIEKDLMQILPKNKWVLFSHQIIHHGRAVCVARKPRCGQCSIEDLCYAPDKTV